MDGKPMPESFTKGQPIAQLQGQQLDCLGPQSPFQQVRQERAGDLRRSSRTSASVADDICIIRSMTTEEINHDPAHTFMNTGTHDHRPAEHGLVGHLRPGQRGRRPARLRRADLDGRGRPAAADRGAAVAAAASCRASSRASSSSSKGDPVLYVEQPGGRLARAAGRRRRRDQRAQRAGTTTCVDDPEIATRIAQYEMAFRMQASVPELMDLRGRARSTLDLYGAEPGDGSFAANCLLARRLAERGVRFIQLYHRDWDHHGGSARRCPVRAGEVDRACAALIKDLKRRGMLDDTLVVWGGEFGRTPMAQGNKGPTAAITTSRASRSGWPAAASRAGSPTGRPTSSATTPSRTCPPSTTCTRRCCTCSASTTTPSASSSRASTPGSRASNGRRSSEESLPETDTWRLRSDSLRTQRNIEPNCPIRGSKDDRPDPFPSHTRRAFLGKTAQGLGAVALAALLRPSLLQAAPSRGVLGTLPLPQKAKRVIWLTMAGGPSHLETFDHKPKLAEMHGKPMPESFTKGQPIAQLQGQKLICFGPQHAVQEVRQAADRRSASCSRRSGRSLDEICIIRSMNTEAINHDPAHMFMNTGSQIAGRPSMGAWVTYGLGSEADDLPGFVVLTSLGQGRAEPADRRAAVDERLPAEPFPGRPASRQGRPGALPEQPAGRQPRAAGRRSSPRSTRSTAGTTRWRTIRKSPRASPSTRWRSGCRPACPS